MLNRDWSQTGSRIVLLIGQFLILLACIVYMQYVYLGNINPDKLAKETFQETNCFLVGKKLSSKGHLIRGYRADFLISYNVNGAQYNRWVSGNGLDTSYFRDQSGQEDLLSQYQIGSSYLCYFDPATPTVALLVLRHNWLSTFPLMVPSVVTVIVLYYFLKNLLQLLGSARSKTRTLVQERKEKKQNKRE